MPYNIFNNAEELGKKIVLPYNIFNNAEELEKKKIYQGKFHRRNQQQWLTIYSTMPDVQYIQQLQVFLKSGDFRRSCWSRRIEYHWNFPLPNKTISFTIFTASYNIRQYYNLQPILQYLQYLMIQFTIFTKCYNTIYSILLQLWRKDWPIKLLKSNTC